MSDIYLFHSVLGVRPAILAAAQHWREACHSVHTPDLLDGAVYDDLATAVPAVNAIGMDEMARRAIAAVVDARPGFIAAGFSGGAGAAQIVATADERARGLLLFHGAGTPIRPWPSRLPVQIQVADPDPWIEREVVDDLLQAALEAGAKAELYLYRGLGHLFTDVESAEGDPAAAALLMLRADGFLASIGGE